MAATIFDLPPYDVLFPHIFSHLEVVDIWKLRRVCKDLHKLCWDYFTNVCSSLSFPFNDNHLGADAGVVILRKCTKLEELEINGSHNQENKKWLHKLLSSLIEGDSLVRKLHFKCVCIDSTMFPLLDGLSKTCHQLTHLELFRTEITEAPVQFFLFQMLKHTNGTLQELSMNCLNLTPDHPPLINMLTGLIRFSVSPLSKLCTRTGHSEIGHSNHTNNCSIQRMKGSPIYLIVIDSAVQ